MGAIQFIALHNAGRPAGPPGRDLPSTGGVKGWFLASWFDGMTAAHIVSLCWRCNMAESPGAWAARPTVFWMMR